MSRIQYIRRIASVLTGFAAALMAAVMGGPAAFAATRTYPPPEPPAGPPPRVGPVVHTYAGVTGSGMAGWQIALIAVGAAIVGAAVAVLVYRAREARHHLRATAA